MVRRGASGEANSIAMNSGSNALVGKKTKDVPTSAAVENSKLIELMCGCGEDMTGIQQYYVLPHGT